jgi:hypothetical protein
MITITKVEREMDKLDTVLLILKSQGVDANIENEHQIVWTDLESRKNSIVVDNIDISGENVAWFQSDDDNSIAFFRILENRDFFDIKPLTKHPDYGCDVHLIEWYMGHLLLIYHEKHNVVITAVKDKKIKEVQFHGDQLIRRGNKLYYKPYGPNQNVKILQIPELIALGEISIEEAEQNNVVPETLGYLNFLKQE